MTLKLYIISQEILTMENIDHMILDTFSDDDFKKELKREKNRKHAAKSRLKKNNKINFLEIENSRMSQEIDELKEELIMVYQLYGDLRDTLDGLVY